VTISTCVLHGIGDLQSRNDFAGCETRIWNLLSVASARPSPDVGGAIDSCRATWEARVRRHLSFGIDWAIAGAATVVTAAGWPRRRGFLRNSCDSSLFPPTLLTL